MKFVVLFSLFLGLVSCSRNPPLKTEKGFQPVVAISSTPNDAVEKDRFPSNAVIETENPWISVDEGNKKRLPVGHISEAQDLFTLPTPEIRNDEEPFFKEYIKSGARKFGLSNLEQAPISKDDIEIRIWQFSDLFMRIYKDMAIKESVFILKRRNGVWSAEVFRRTVKTHNLKVEKRFRTKLGVPKSGWENVWQKLIDRELLTFPDSFTRKVVPEPDSGLCVIESRVGAVFRSFQHAGGIDKREIRYGARILNVIAGEFELEDFQSTKSYEE